MPAALRQLAESRQFQFAILGLIIVAAIVVGLETDPWFVSTFGEQLHLLNKVILWAFVAEAAIKMGQHGTRFYRYFFDPWNLFDFAVIAVCFLPVDASYAAVLRLARVFRSLRLVTAIPKLQVLVNALIRSIPSMMYVGLLLFLLFYVYGVMGVFLFRDNDPVHFGDLPTSMLSLFRVVTQEDWTDVMYLQMYGSDVYPQLSDDLVGKLTDLEVTPSGDWWLGMTFFVSFVFLGTMIMLNLFIGVILNSMDTAQKESDAKHDGDEASPNVGLATIADRLDEIADRLAKLEDRLDADG